MGPFFPKRRYKINTVSCEITQKIGRYHLPPCGSLKSPIAKPLMGCGILIWSIISLASLAVPYSVYLSSGRQGINTGRHCNVSVMFI